MWIFWKARILQLRWHCQHQHILLVWVNNARNNNASNSSARVVNVYRASDWKPSQLALLSFPCWWLFLEQATVKGQDISQRTPAGSQERKHKETGSQGRLPSLLGMVLPPLGSHASPWHSCSWPCGSISVSCARRVLSWFGNERSCGCACYGSINCEHC